MPKYFYDGCVMEFSFCVCDRWRASTSAPSEAKARCNLAYRFKKEHGLAPHANVKLPGPLTVLNEEDHYTFTGKHIKAKQISIDEIINDI